jgi:hypothetical protein
MLFERWDKSRGLYVTVPFEAQIRPAMMYLAHWLYTTDLSAAGVSEQKLVAKAAEFLYPLAFETIEEAQSAAKDFIGFCRGRAWVFSDVGSTREGESLYHYTHRTFLEYFTAGYLARRNPLPQDLARVLSPRIQKQEWDVVAQLAFQIASKTVDGAPETLMSTLVDAASKESEGIDARMNLWYFAVRALSFMVVSPQIRRSVTRTAMAFCADVLCSDKTDSALRGVATDTLGAFLRVTRENRATVADELRMVLAEMLASSQEECGRIVAAEVVGAIPHALFATRASPSESHSGVPGSEEEREYWGEFAKGLFKTERDVLIAIATSNKAVAAAFYRNGWLSMEEVLELAGLSVLLLGSEAFRRLQSVGWSAPVGLLAIHQKADAVGVRTVGERVLAGERIDARQIGRRGRVLYSEPHVAHLMDSGTSFGAFVIMAAMDDADVAILDEMRGRRQPASTVFEGLFRTRRGERGGGVRLKDTEFVRLGWTDAQVEFARRWAAGDVDIARPLRRRSDRNSQ